MKHEKSLAYAAFATVCVVWGTTYLAIRIAVDRQPEIDGLIEKHAPNWRLERMAAVDRNVLRTSVAEFLGYRQTPVPVIINEALEIARRFSAPESVQFINGVLDAVAKSLEGKPRN